MGTLIMETLPEESGDYPWTSEEEWYEDEDEDEEWIEEQSNFIFPD